MIIYYYIYGARWLDGEGDDENESDNDDERATDDEDDGAIFEVGNETGKLDVVRSGGVGLAGWVIEGDRRCGFLRVVSWGGGGGGEVGGWGGGGERVEISRRVGGGGSFWRGGA